jgi:hypothetical protein
VRRWNGEFSELQLACTRWFVVGVVKNYFRTLQRSVLRAICRPQLDGIQGKHIVFSICFHEESTVAANAPKCNRTSGTHSGCESATSYLAKMAHSNDFVSELRKITYFSPGNRQQRTGSKHRKHDHTQTTQTKLGPAARMGFTMVWRRKPTDFGVFGTCTTIVTGKMRSSSADHV